MGLALPDTVTSGCTSSAFRKEEDMHMVIIILVFSMPYEDCTNYFMLYEAAFLIIMLPIALS